MKKITLLVNILILNPRSGQYPLSVFGGNVSCNGNAPEMGFQAWVRSMAGVYSWMQTESLVWERKSRPAKGFVDQNEVVCRLRGVGGCSPARGWSWGLCARSDGAVWLPERPTGSVRVAPFGPSADVPVEVSSSERPSLRLHSARGWVQRPRNQNRCYRGSGCVFYALS